MLCYSDRKVTLSRVWVFFPEEFNSYIKSTLKGLKSCQVVAWGMLGYSDRKVRLGCVWVFFPEEFNGRRTNWLSEWLLDELRECNSKFIRRVVVLWLPIHTTQKFLTDPYYASNEELIVLENCGVMFTGQTRLRRGNSPLIWSIHSALLNFLFEINMAPLNNALQNTR